MSRRRACWLGAPAMFNLQAACTVLVEAYGPHIYLVGSCLERRDYRDVDVRCMLGDAEFARLFPGSTTPTHWHARLNILNAAISEWLAARTGLPIDFQFQQSSDANAQFLGPRSALGHYFAREEESDVE